MPMLGSLSSIAGDVPLRIGVLEINIAAVGLLKGLKGFKEEEYSWRMEWRVPSGLGAHRFLFGIGSAARG